MKKTRPAAAKEGMRPESRGFKGIFSFPFILLVFVLVATASFVLLRGSVQGLSRPGFFDSASGFIMLFAAPLSLIALGLALFYAFASDIFKTGKTHSSAMRNFRLVCAFAIIASALFCVFANTFISELFPFYHDDSIEVAMDSATEIAEAYAASRFLEAEAVAEQFFTGVSIRNMERSPQSWLPAIRQHDPSALAVQVYRIDDESGDLVPIKEEGDSSVFLSAEQIAQMRNGIDKNDEEAQASGERTHIRVKKTVRYAGLAYVALYTSLFPQEIYRATAAAERAKARFAVVLKAEPLFPYFGFWLYFSFILPPLLILLLCCLYVFVRLSDPIASLEEACEGLMHGKAGAALVPQKYAGLDSTIRFVNARSDAISSNLELEAARGNGPSDEEASGEDAADMEEDGP